MSTQAEAVNPTRLVEAIQSVRDDSSGDQVVVVSHVDNKSDLIDTVHTGASFSDLQNILDPQRVMYVLARFKSTFDMSETVKFVYIHWIGSKVPYGLRARCGVVHESVRDRFDPFHLALEVDSLDDLKEDEIIAKLEDSTGKRSHIIESQELDGRQERGFTANQSQIKTKSINTTKINAPVTKGATVTFDDSVQDNIYDVRDDGTGTNWMVAGYQDGDPKKPIRALGSGTGGLTELNEMFEDNQAMYGLFRTTDRVDDITTVKFIYIVWIGENVKPMSKAKVSTHKGSCEEMFKPAHVTIFATDSSDLSTKTIMDKVTSASGSKSNVM